MKAILTTPTPHICKTYAPKYTIQWGSVWHKSSSESRDFYRKYGIRTPKYGIRTPSFMPYEPFLLGVGVVFYLLSRYLERPCASQEGASMLLTREAGFSRREGGPLRRGEGFLRRGGGFLRKVCLVRGTGVG